VTDKRKNMKLKYFLLLAAVAIMSMTGCSVNNDPTYLSEVQVSSSYVAISMDGGSTAITVNASSDWTITKCPSWLTISDTIGSAGTTEVTFSAESTLDGRSAEVLLNCGGKEQHINVIQGLSTISDATCAEVLAGPDSKTYQVTGTCVKISNDTYGNWYLADATGQVYIYGTLDANGGTKNFTSLGIEEGDIVTVQGPKTTYNGTVELVNVTVVNIEKSLIKVDSVSVEDAFLPKTGGYLTAYLTCKGSGMSVDMSESANTWISMSSLDISGGTSATVEFYIEPNTEGDRQDTVVFKTTSGGVDYTTKLVISQEGNIVDATIAEFLAAEVGDTQYRITGTITEIQKAEYGNIYIQDETGTVYVYGIGSKGDFETYGLGVGDQITLIGKRGEYKGTPQMVKATRVAN